jgi:hypothetical protein
MVAVSSLQLSLPKCEWPLLNLPDFVAYFVP